MMSRVDVKYRAVETLRKGGIANPARLVKLIEGTIGFFKLNLSELTVLTEAASGPYVVTPVIASMARAKRVLALTSDSSYAKAETVISQTRALEVLCGVKCQAEIYTKRTSDLFAQADIVTNLGFVRPIGAEIVEAMKPTAVIPLMCEAWEFREGDVDLDACREKRIPVMGTNEDYPGLEIFDYIGWLCLKMLFDAQIEIHKSRILLVSSDKFGISIEKQLACAAGSVRLVPNLRRIKEQELTDADALVIADYTRNDVIIGQKGDLTVDELASVAPHLTIIQFAGRIDIESISKHRLHVYPVVKLESRRMAFTLGEIGPRPVIELHTAGLKVGEITARLRLKGLSLSEVKSTIHRTSTLAQPIGEKAY